MNDTQGSGLGAPTSAPASASADAASGVDLAGINMNLLLALDALLSERSVGRAASRMGMTQSGMSHALRQLRERLNDQLLTRQGNKMLLTPRAARLAPTLQKALQDLRRALSDSHEFEPATSNRRFVLTASDAISVFLLPKMLNMVWKEAPSADLEIQSATMGRLADLLESGEIDVGVGPILPDTPGIRCMKLFDEELVCVVRNGHPAARRKLDIESYTKLQHAMITVTGRGGGPVDAALERLGRKRRIALRIHSFIGAPIVVASTDLILTMPRRAAELLATGFPLTVLPPPLELPKGRVMMFWHERFEHDPGGRWLRKLILRARDSSDEGAQ